MDADEKVLDNSLESTMNMSQDDIEKLLLQYEEQGKAEETTIAELDLESLLAGLDDKADADIQDISELLNKSERNQAVDEEVMALLKSQEEEGLTAYDAMDLFSKEGAPKKEGFISKLFGKSKKHPKEKKQKKEPKKSRKKQQKEQQDKKQQVLEKILQRNNNYDRIKARKSNGYKMLLWEIIM